VVTLRDVTVSLNRVPGSHNAVNVHARGRQGTRGAVVRRHLVPHGKTLHELPFGLRLLGGRLEIETAPGCGTSIFVNVPVTKPLPG
jgi:hypothetical protein